MIIKTVYMAKVVIASSNDNAESMAAELKALLGEFLRRIGAQAVVVSVTTTKLEE